MITKKLGITHLTAVLNEGSWTTLFGKPTMSVYIYQYIDTHAPATNLSSISVVHFGHHCYDIPTDASCRLLTLFHWLLATHICSWVNDQFIVEIMLSHPVSMAAKTIPQTVLYKVPKRTETIL